MRFVSAKQLFVAAFVTMSAALAPLSAQAQQKAEPYKVVLQVSDGDPAKWNLALNNANNIMHDLGKGNVSIEIVAYGPGIAMLKSESKVAARLAQALDNNVGIEACENSMHAFKLQKSEMYDGIAYVPSGVVHIMQRQREGWQYIRP